MNSKGYQEEKRYFNGRTQDDIHGTTELGIHGLTYA